MRHAHEAPIAGWLPQKPARRVPGHQRTRGARLYGVARPGAPIPRWHAHRPPSQAGFPKSWPDRGLATGAPVGAPRRCGTPTGPPRGPASPRGRPGGCRPPARTHGAPQRRGTRPHIGLASPEASPAGGPATGAPLGPLRRRAPAGPRSRASFPPEPARRVPRHQRTHGVPLRRGTPTGPRSRAGSWSRPDGYLATSPLMGRLRSVAHPWVSIAGRLPPKPARRGPRHRRRTRGAAPVAGHSRGRPATWRPPAHRSRSGVNRPHGSLVGGHRLHASRVTARARRSRSRRRLHASRTGSHPVTQEVIVCTLSRGRHLHAGHAAELRPEADPPGDAGDRPARRGSNRRGCLDFAVEAPGTEQEPSDPLLAGSSPVGEAPAARVPLPSTGQEHTIVTLRSQTDTITEDPDYVERDLKRLAGVERSRGWRRLSCPGRVTGTTGRGRRRGPS